MAKKRASKEPIIDDDPKSMEVLYPVGVGRGLVPRDYKEFPEEMFAPPAELPLIPRSEWSARIKEMEEQESRISDILLAGNVPVLDQGQVGYCWAHSTVGCVQAVRAINNQPMVPLSAYAVAAIIKRGRDEGGWCGLSAKFLREVGVPTQKLWPQGDRNLKYDTPEMRANAGLHKVSEEWVDLTKEVYDVDLTFDQVMTCLLSRNPCAGDFNYMSHSVMLCDPVEVERGSFGIRFRNSWKDFGDRGFAVMRGTKAFPDSALAILVSGATPI